MENNKVNYAYDNVIEVNDASASRKYLAKVFTWMFVALGVSAFMAYLFATNLSLLTLIIDPVAGRFTTLGYVSIFAPVAFSLVANFGFNRVSYPVMLVLFLAYAATIGVSLSILGLIYTSGSIFTVFLSSAGVFGVMSIAGYTTQQDLTKLGSILAMAFMAAFVVSLVNFFMGSEQLQYILSLVFVIVLIGLTAYHIQTLKRIGAGIEFGSESANKLVIIGAFVLYTTFINLFMSMLRIFGNRR